jgi:two-component system, LytTR family, response regulator
VDDERLARRELRHLLEAGHPDAVRVVGEAESVHTAAELVRTMDADLVFLDVQLAGESGLDLLERLDPTVAVIFVTAFDRYAVRAFEVNALDYLLKPVAPDRLSRAVARLERGAAAAVAPASPPLGRQDRLFLRCENRMGFVTVGDIVAISADGDYSTVLTVDGHSARLRKPLREWEARLPSATFARIHRSTICNLNLVERVEEWSHLSYHLHLRGLREPLLMSRRYAARVRAKLG